MTELLTQEQIDSLTEAFGQLVDAVSNFIQVFAEKVIKPIVDAVFEFLKTAWDALLATYAKSKVRHLALHGKKYRTRKKNLHRMQKEFIKLLSG